MKVETIFLKPAPGIPNSRLPSLIYRTVMSGDIAAFETMLRANGWFPDWYSNMGLFPKHHFHSDAHELIAFASGSQIGKLGGDGGVDVELKAGDVLVLPAGRAPVRAQPCDLARDEGPRRAAPRVCPLCEVGAHPCASRHHMK